MKLKELEGHLQALRGFDRPKVAWEQYATTPHLAGTSIRGHALRVG
jgi:predicted RNA methylase